MSSITDPIRAEIIVNKIEGLRDEDRPRVMAAVQNALDKCDAKPTGWFAPVDALLHPGKVLYPATDPTCWKQEYETNIKPLLTPAGEPPVNGKAR